VTDDVLAMDAYFFQPESKIRWIGEDMMNTASDNFDGESEPAAIPLYYYLRGGTGGEVTFTVYQGEVAIAELTGSGTAGLHKVLWNMDKREERSPEQVEQMRQRMARFGGGGMGGGDIRFVSTPAPLGEYTVVMSANGQTMKRRVSIRKDDWWMDRR
jgi:hypothetical protein